MSIINDIFRGAIILSIFALMQNSCSVQHMVSKAAKAHAQGLSSYGEYSRRLTSVKDSWVKQQAYGVRFYSVEGYPAMVPIDEILQIEQFFGQKKTLSLN